MKLAHFVAAATLALAASAHAQPEPSDHAAHHPATAASKGAVAKPSDGEVRKVDKEQGKITLKHGPIENLGMAGMTMVFKVADPKMLDGVKPGDKVTFTADNVKGAMTVTAIQAVR